VTELSNNLRCMPYLFSLADGIPPALATAWEESTRGHKRDQGNGAEYSALADKLHDLLTVDTSSQKKDVYSAEVETGKAEFDNKLSATTAVVNSSPETKSLKKVSSKRKAKTDVETVDITLSPEKISETTQKKARIVDRNVSSTHKDAENDSEVRKSEDVTQCPPYDHSDAEEQVKTETMTDAKEANNFSFEIMSIASAFPSALKPNPAKKRGKKQNPLNAALEEHDKMIEADKLEDPVTVMKSSSSSDSSSSSSSISRSSYDSSDSEEEGEEKKDNETKQGGETTHAWIVAAETEESLQKSEGGAKKKSANKNAEGGGPEPEEDALVGETAASLLADSGYSPSRIKDDKAGGEANYKSSSAGVDEQLNDEELELATKFDLFLPCESKDVNKRSTSTIHNDSDLRSSDSSSSNASSSSNSSSDIDSDGREDKKEGEQDEIGENVEAAVKEYIQDSAISAKTEELNDAVVGDGPEVKTAVDAAPANTNDAFPHSDESSSGSSISSSSDSSSSNDSESSDDDSDVEEDHGEMNEVVDKVSFVAEAKSRCSDTSSSAPNNPNVNLNLSQASMLVPTSLFRENSDTSQGVIAENERKRGSNNSLSSYSSSTSGTFSEDGSDLLQSSNKQEKNNKQEEKKVEANEVEKNSSVILSQSHETVERPSRSGGSDSSSSSNNESISSGSSSDSDNDEENEDTAAAMLIDRGQPTSRHDKKTQPSKKEEDEEEEVPGTQDVSFPTNLFNSQKQKEGGVGPIENSRDILDVHSSSSSGSSSSSTSDSSSSSDSDTDSNSSSSSSNSDEAEEEDRKDEKHNSTPDLASDNAAPSVSWNKRRRRTPLVPLSRKIVVSTTEGCQTQSFRRA